MQIQTKVSVENIDFYRQRRAKPGQGKLKAQLLTEFSQMNSAITHYVIAHSSDDAEAQKARSLCELECQRIARRLIEVTLP